MTVTLTDREVSSTANGTSTTFAVTFPFYELEVYADGALVAPSNYYIAQVSPGGTGSVIFYTAPAAGVKIAIASATAATQPLDLANDDPFRAETLEGQLDRVALALQDLLAKTKRTPAGAPDTLVPSLAIDAADDNDNRLVYLNTDGEIDVLRQGPGLVTLGNGGVVQVASQWGSSQNVPVTLEGISGADTPTGDVVVPGTYSHNALANLTADDHPQYLTNARGDARYDPLGTSIAAIAAHLAASDPHAQYLLTAEGDARYVRTVNGIVPDGSGNVTVAGGGGGGGTGDVVGPAASVDGEVALFNGTTGKGLKRATASGIAKLTAGVLSAAVAGTDYAAAINAAPLIAGSEARKILRVNAAGSAVENVLPLFNFVDVVAVYGIDNSGATDVSSALQAAITAICAAGRAVYIPDGTYNCGSTTVTVPANGRVTCGRNAVIRRTAEPNTPAPLFDLGARTLFENGVLDHNVVATSTTSNTIPGTTGGTLTFTVQSGLGYVNGMTLYIWTAANKWVQGTVSLYVGTTLQITVTGFNGTGTYATWKVTVASANNAAIRSLNGTGARVTGTRVISAEYKWQVGFLFDGATRGAASDCECTGAINRAFYAYRVCTDVTFDRCHADGASLCAYGFNVNPAAQGLATRIKILGSVAVNMAAQGFEFGDWTLRSVMSGCVADTIANTGFLIQFANGGFAQYNSIVGCTAASCTVYGFAVIGTFYNSLTSCEAVSCGTGLLFGSVFYQPTSTTYYPQYNSATGFRADACTTVGILFVNGALMNSCIGVSIIGAGVTVTGVQFDTGSQKNRVDGNAAANTTNIVDNGTGNVKDITV